MLLILVVVQVEQKVERLRQTEASLEKRIEREQAEVDRKTISYLIFEIYSKLFTF